MTVGHYGVVLRAQCRSLNAQWAQLTSASSLSVVVQMGVNRALREPSHVQHFVIVGVGSGSFEVVHRLVGVATFHTSRTERLAVQRPHVLLHDLNKGKPIALNIFRNKIHRSV